MKQLHAHSMLSLFQAQKSTAESRSIAKAETFDLMSRYSRGCHGMGRLNGQTSSSLTGRTSGLPL